MSQQGISKLDLKRQNRMQILNLIKQYGPMARIDLAVKLQITRAAVTIITNDMIEQGVLIEVGEQHEQNDKASRGRKKMLIDINYNHVFAIGIYLDKSYVIVGLSTLAGDTLDKRITCIDGITIDSAAYDFIRTSIKELLTGNCLKEQDIIGMGIAVSPEIYDILNIVQNDKGVNYTSFEKQISKITQLRTVFINSVKSIALANIDFSKNKGIIDDSVMLIQYGNEMHSTIISKNDIMINDRTDNICKYTFPPINRESEYRFIQDVIVPKAILKEIHGLFSSETTPDLSKKCDGDVNNIKLSMLINCQDEVIKSYLREIKIYFTSFILNVLSLVHAKKLILHSFGDQEKAFIKYILDSIQDDISKYISGNIQLSKIDHNQMFLGGCVVAIREFFYNKGGF